MPKVDFSAYVGREQAYVKHCLLEEYLPTWGYKIGSAWDCLVFVDAFAGPWGVTSPTFKDSSFGVAIDVLKKVYLGQREKWKRNVQVLSVLVGNTGSKVDQLKQFAQSRTSPGFKVETVQANFIDGIPQIAELITKNSKNPFKFVFLDPKGWKDIPMRPLIPLLRGSSEVLVNLMTSDIRRFLEESTRAESYINLFGRDGVLELLQKTPAEERGEGAVREYCKSLKQLCGFKYVSSAVIFEPQKEEVKYFLVFGTNHPDGVEVFKAAEMNAARIQDEVRHEVSVRNSRQPEMFCISEVPRSRVKMEKRAAYCQKAYAKLVKLLLADHSNEGVLYKDVLMEALAFPLVTPEDVKVWIENLKDVILVALEGEGKRKSPRTDKNDRIFVIDRYLLAANGVNTPLRRA